jgi:hypothetical protein
MSVQNLPTTATEYARASRREQRAALAAIRRQWRRMGPDFDSSWAEIAPTLLAIIGLAQRRTAELADAYIPAVLEETGQTRSIHAAAETRIEAFVGVTGAGVTVADQVSVAPIRAKQAVAGGASQDQALVSAGQWLTATSGTILSDTGRAVETTGMATRNVSGYVRMLSPPSCGRCAVLAGKFYHANQGFQRHPGCDCRHIPASEAIGGDMTLDLNAYLGSLDEAGQVKVLGSKANREAWSKYGAEPQQIINSYRGGIRTAQDVRGNTVRYTTDAATRRSLATYRMRNASRLERDAGAIRLANGKTGLVRRMPETILRTSSSPEAVVRQLRLYGWIA